MELSSRDRRILAEIECGSALEAPRWVRRLERLGDDRGARRRVLRHVAAAVAAAAWVAAVVLGCSSTLRPLLWAALCLGGLAAARFVLLLRRRRRRGPRSHRRLIPRIPRQERSDGGAGL